MNLKDIESVAEKLEIFAKDREWEQFHSPKNISMALSVEAAELMEIFQWMTQEESKVISGEKLENAAQEIADIAIYLIRISDILNIDITKELHKKIDDNQIKYPINHSKGNSKKYTEFTDK